MGNYSSCEVDNICFLGDERCDSDVLAGYNTKECNFDGGDCICEFPDDRFDYSSCDVEVPCFLGNDRCEVEYNTAECNYDGGDCICEFTDDGDGFIGGDCVCNFPDDGFDYSSCGVNVPCRIGDGYCDESFFYLQGYGSEECNYDGGDCDCRSFEENVFPDDGFNYTSCDVPAPCRIGDGFCDRIGYNTPECNYDGNDCDPCIFPDDGFDYSSCDAPYVCYIGDGNCDGPDYDNAECNRDGRDCSFINQFIDFITFLTSALVVALSLGALAASCCGSSVLIVICPTIVDYVVVFFFDIAIAIISFVNQIPRI